jgi:hypothetical protein
MCYLCIELGRIKKNKNMLVVSTKEFRDNQKSYLDKIDSGIEVFFQFS